MLEKFRLHIQQNLSFLTKGKVLVAISGGIDSVVLAHILHKLQIQFSLAHCNFKLREEDSDKDEVFVQHLAVELGVPCHSISFQTKEYAKKNQLSTQMAARELRYNWFKELQEKQGYSYVLTAHHANDNLETQLINLTRGCSLNGLTGIPEINGTVVRPLLPFTRSEIEQFTITYAIQWREDESNASTKYVRNKIRHDVIPELQELNPQLISTFNTHLAYLKKEHNVLKFHLEQVKNELCIEGDFLQIDIKKLQKYPDYEVYLRYILLPYQFTDWKAIHDMCTTQSGKVSYSKTHKLLKDRNYLVVSNKNQERTTSVTNVLETDSAVNYPVVLNFKKVLATKELSLTNVFVDADKLNYPLQIRKKQDGDYFYPAGMNGKKKLSKYFKDEKLSLFEKEAIWLLCDAKNTIIWIVGKRLDARFDVSKHTKNILRITQN